MATPTTLALASLLLGAATPGPVAAQQTTMQATPPGGLVEVTASLDTTHRIPGTVRDLSRDAAGRILYCTFERDVGRIEPGKVRTTLLASAASSPFEGQLRGVTPNLAGDVATVDTWGNVYVVPGAGGPAVKVYSDLYMIADATDIVCDARGSYLIASATPSSGQRGINWISGNGQRWSYYLVRHQPVQLAHDPLTGGLVYSEATAGGNVQLVTAGSAVRATSALDATTHPGMSSAADDGNVALEADGDFYWVAGGSVWKRNRANGVTQLFASGYQPLHGAVIAESHGWQWSSTGWSLYLAEGSDPTKIREIAGVGAPAGVIASDQGEVPHKGTKINVVFGFQAFDVAADDTGRLLVGGTQFGSTHHVKRVTLTGTPSIAVVASNAHGISGVVEGLCVAPDDSILLLTRDGAIQRITEGPIAVATLFADAGNQITAGKDLALDVNGAFYVAARESWDFGKVMQVSGGVASLLTTTEETRGLAANPAGGLFFSQWHNTGFHGTVDLYHFDDDTVEGLPGFATMNYTNDFVWGDGDLCVDANGSIYSVSEDDWSLVRYDPAQDGFVRFGSSYLNHPSGLAIAPSTAGSGSTTGWSLYVAEFDNLWEKPSVQPPASVLVDSTLGMSVGRSVAAAPDPRFGKPRAIAPAGGGLVVGTSGGHVLAVDPWSGAVLALAGPEQGLRGAIVSVSVSRDGRRVRALSDEGALHEIEAGRARVLARDPERVATAMASALADPRRVATLSDPRAGTPATFALDGWVVWRVAE